jgi:S-adenosylmethionine:tRNA ribosyltransferase-isomerase
MLLSSFARASIGILTPFDTLREVPLQPILRARRFRLSFADASEALLTRYNSRSMWLSEFQYPLPEDLIAQQPLVERDRSRLMLLNRAAGTIEDRTFLDFPGLLLPSDLLVFNNTKVFPARLLGRRRGSRVQKISPANRAARDFLAAEIELLLTRDEGGGVWWGLVHPGRKAPVGEMLIFGDGELEAELIGREPYGVRRVKLRARSGSVEDAIDRLGHVPLPPYIRRHDAAADRETYQTVYARVRGAVAAPTAGLHFTDQVLAQLRARGIETAEITLHVGLGTFQPVRAERIEDHVMEAEAFEISERTATAVNRALAERRRVIAVGTTTVRTLEHAAHEHGGRIEPGRGATRLFIHPGFKFLVTSGLLTNFHLPKSTLLMLVSAFAGREFILRAYHQAIEERYRFYSYGDCMLIV